MIEIRPQAGPQEMFCSSKADIAIFGGSAGPGKSWALTFEAARNADVPGYAAIIFRRTKPELTGGGSLWEEAQKMYPLRGGMGREHRLDWTFPTRERGRTSVIEYDGLQYESDKHGHQGKQYAFIGFDEVTHFTEGQFWYLVGRLRSTCGISPYMRCTCNPDPDSFVRKLIDWWIGPDGYPLPERAGVLRWFLRVGEGLVWGDSREELVERYAAEFAADNKAPPDPMSFTFIPAKLEDNKKGDPKYRSKLEGLPLIDRMRLLYGNWNFRPVAGTFFKRHYFKVVPLPPVDVVKRVRAWDKAATEPNAGNPDPDWSVGVRMAKSRSGVLTVEHVARERLTPGKTEDMIRNTASSDGKEVEVAMWQDPAQAGKSDVANFAKLLMGYIFHAEPTSSDKQTFAKPASSAAEHGHIELVEGPWNEPFLSILEGFPDATHDDDVDALSLAFMRLVESELRIR